MELLNKQMETNKQKELMEQTLGARILTELRS